MAVHSGIELKHAEEDTCQLRNYWGSPDLNGFPQSSIFIGYFYELENYFPTLSKNLGMTQPADINEQMGIEVTAISTASNPFPEIHFDIDPKKIKNYTK